MCVCVFLLEKMLKSNVNQNGESNWRPDVQGPRCLNRHHSEADKVLNLPKKPFESKESEDTGYSKRPRKISFDASNDCEQLNEDPKSKAFQVWKRKKKTTTE